MTVSKATVSLLVLSLTSSAAFSDDIHCQSEYGNVTLDDDVVIAAPCTFDGTEVDGKITIFAGGSLTAIDAKIDGNIKARDADFLNLQNSEIDGNIDLRDMVGDTISIRDNVVEGRIVLKRNRSRLNIHNNFIEKKLEVEENSGGVVITENVIDDNLECKKNTPVPSGSNNQVSGKRQDQCRNLEAVDLPVEPEDPPAEPENEEPPAEPDDQEPPAEPGPSTPTTVGPNPPDFEINSGTGGGGSLGTWWVMLLFFMRIWRSSRRVD